MAGGISEPALADRLGRVRGNAPPRAPANLDAVHELSVHVQTPSIKPRSNTIAAAGVGTTAYRGLQLANVRASSESSPPSSLRLLVQARKAQRHELLWGITISGMSDARPEMKRIRT